MWVGSKCLSYRTPEVYTSHCDSNNWLANIWLVTWLAQIWQRHSDLWFDLHPEKTWLDLTCNLAVIWLDANHFQVTESPSLASSSSGLCCRQQNILGLKSQPQNCSGVGFCSGIENKVRGLSHRLQWGDNFVLTNLFLIIIRPITWAFSSNKPMKT